MSKKSKQIVLVLGLLLSGALIWHLSRNQPISPTRQTPFQAEGGKVREERPAARQSHEKGLASSAAETRLDKPATTPGSRRDASAGESQMKEIVETKNVPIDFWGRIIDQYEKPIAGVRIVMRVRHWELLPAAGPTSTSPRVELLSDSDGRFEWHGQTGDTLSIEAVEKADYKLSPRARNGFSYGPSPEPFTPDPSQPVVIRMWRLGPGEPTVSNRGFFGFVPDGRLYTLDLIKNQKHENPSGDGDLTVRISRPSEIKPRDRYSWDLELAAIEGGIAEATDEFLYQAPETGYESKLRIKMDPADPNWTSVLRRQFYFRSRSGRVYGVIQMTVRPDYAGESAIQVESVVNPNGSRNLQR
jgi:hypothetical protein